MLENDTGIFTEINSDSIAESIIKYIENPEIKKKHGRNGRHFVIKNYGQEKIWNEVKKLIDKS